MCMQRTIRMCFFSWASIFGIPLYFGLIVRMALDCVFFSIFDQKIRKRRKRLKQTKQKFCCCFFFSFQVELRLNIKDLRCRRFKIEIEILFIYELGWSQSAKVDVHPNIVDDRKANAQENVCVFNWFFTAIWSVFFFTRHLYFIVWKNNEYYMTQIISWRMHRTHRPKTYE